MRVFRAILLLVLVAMIAAPVWQYDHAQALRGIERVSMRTESSKTFYLGDNRYRTVVSGGILHYKDDYNDTVEPWKDIDLTIKDGRLTTAPYELTVGATVTFKDKRTGDVATMALSKLGDVRTATSSLCVVPYNEGVRLQRQIRSASDALSAEFDVSLPKDSSIRLHASAIDADGAPVPVDYSLENGKLRETVSLEGAKLPVTVDPSLEVQPAAKDNMLSEANPTLNQGSAANLNVRDQVDAAYRPILEFDISSIPASAILVSATLGLNYYGSGGTVTGKTVWAYKLTRTDWVEAQATWNIYKTGSNWSTAGGDYVTSDPAGGSTTVPGSFGWMSWDVTDIVQDAIDAEQAAEILVKFETEDLGSGYGYCQFRSSEYATAAARPKLTVEYEAGAAPDITTNAATEVNGTSARLNAYVDYDGGEACEVRFEYDEDSGAPYAQATDWVPGYLTGQSVYDDITGLDLDTEYFFRAQIKNSDSTVDGDELSFTTAASIGAPSDLIATASDSTTVVLVWQKGDGAGQTEVRRKVGSYPTNSVDGTLVYEGSLASATDTGRTPGVSYYYRAWGLSGELESDGYASDMVTMPLTGAPEAGEISPPVQPSGWFQAPDGSGLDNVPGSGLVTQLAGAMPGGDFPVGMMWVILGSFLAVIVTAGVFVYTRNLLVTIIVGSVLLIGLSIGGVLPMWTIFVVIVLGGGGAYMAARA